MRRSRFCESDAVIINAYVPLSTPAVSSDTVAVPFSPAAMDMAFSGMAYGMRFSATRSPSGSVAVTPNVAVEFGLTNM